jgi:protein-disulfide isomerase
MFLIILFLAGCTSVSITNYADVNGRILGSENATVKIYEFTDYACLFCKKAENVVYDIVKKYGNNVKLEHKNFIVHSEAYIAAEAVECSGDQNKFWEYNQLLFDNQNDFSIATLNGYANDLKLNMTEFGLCMIEHKKKIVIEKDIKDAQLYGVKGTPTFVVNDKVLPGLVSIDDISEIIEGELKK